MPFRGGGFRPEVASGRVDFAFSPIAVAVPDIRDGRLLALAVSGSERVVRAAGRADHARGRLPEFRLRALDGRVRAGQDAARHRRAAAPGNHEGAAERRACASGSLRFDVEPMHDDAAEFDAFIKDDIVAQGALAKAAGLKPN